jgi:O-antigen/teichoic acid export membrane protein
MRQHTARGTLVNGTFLVGVSALNLLKGFLLAVFLTREDYGIWGILLITIGTIAWLKQVGIGDRYIQQDDPDQERAYQLAFTLELVLSLAMAALLAALLPVVALVYGRSDLLLPGLALLTILPAGALQTPLWIHYRRMAFVRQRTLQAVDPVLGFVVALGLAIAGAGYWALFGGVLAGAWAAAAVAVWSSPYRLRLRWDRGVLRRYATFSWPLFVASGSGLVIAQAAVLSTSAAVGVAGVGAITLAAQVSQFTDRVDAMITGTLYPAICSVRDRTELLYETFVKSNRLALMWAMPFGLGLALFARDLVAFGIGNEWRPAVIVLEVYGVTAALNHVGFNWDAYFRAREDTRPMAVAAGASAIAFLAVGLPLVFAHGLAGLAAGVAAQAAVGLVVRAVYVARLFDGFALARQAVRALTPPLPAVAVVVALRALEGGERTVWAALAELALFALVCAGATWALERPLLREAISYLRRAPAAPVAT